ncbi:MAG TPA: hypothetical protein VE522_01185, partial [Actinomycetota bacterium]|nr:hypothetical protein [Actinomycetota bacterium]
VRRMMRSGCRANAEPTRGVLHPSIQVSDATPLFGGGFCGRPGGVGEANVGVEGKESDGAADEGFGKRSEPPSQARRSSSVATIMRFFMRYPTRARRG